MNVDSDWLVIVRGLDSGLWAEEAELWAPLGECRYRALAWREDQRAERSKNVSGQAEPGHLAASQHLMYKSPPLFSPSLCVSFSSCLTLSIPLYIPLFPPLSGDLTHIPSLYFSSFPISLSLSLHFSLSFPISLSFCSSIYQFSSLTYEIHMVGNGGHAWEIPHCVYSACAAVWRNIPMSQQTDCTCLEMGSVQYAGLADWLAGCKDNASACRDRIPGTAHIGIG